MKAQYDHIFVGLTDSNITWTVELTSLTTPLAKPSLIRASYFTNKGTPAESAKAFPSVFDVTSTCKIWKCCCQLRQHYHPWQLWKLVHMHNCYLPFCRAVKVFTRWRKSKIWWLGSVHLHHGVLAGWPSWVWSDLMVEDFWQMWDQTFFVSQILVSVVRSLRIDNVLRKQSQRIFCAKL